MNSESKLLSFPNLDNFPLTPKRLFTLIGAVVTVITLFIGLIILRGIYTNWLWFDNLGHLDVYTTILSTRIWLFLAGFIIAFTAIGLNFFWAHKSAKAESSYSSPPSVTSNRTHRLLIAATILAAVLISVIFAVIASGRWESILLFLNRSPFGLVDPILNTDASFYILTLPVLHLFQGWILGLSIIIILGVLIIYFINYSIKGTALSLTPKLLNHLATVGGVTLLTFALGHYLDVYELLFSNQGAAFGASYTDITAKQPGLYVLTFLAGLGGLLLLVSIFSASLRFRLRATIATISFWLIATILVGFIFPSAVQRFIVSPNELKYETPYIKNSIEWTRLGYGLNNITEANYEYQPELTRSHLDKNPETIKNLRLWDPKPARDVYNQVQHLRLYYEFEDVDIDRYMIDGEFRQVILSARELAPEELPEEAQRWVPRKLQYTHGYGAVVSPVTEFTAEGQPEFFLKDIPPTGPLTLDNPAVYYGEKTEEYVIVNTLEKEFDHPATGQDASASPNFVQYSGTGGVPLSSLLRKIAFAWELGDFNLLISGQVTNESRVQYRRQIQDRIKTIAPFLMLDEDPYLVISEGGLFWIQDAYTVTNKLPYSTRYQDEFNYIRNSVKIVVDAFQGTVTFFVSDPDDILVKTYQGMFRELFKPLDEMSETLRSHIRYPEGLFSIQSEMYLQYHMTDPTVFYTKEDQWSIPIEVTFGQPSQVNPYYIIMKLPRLPGENEDQYAARPAEFMQILPFTPSNKPNLVAWLASRSDSAHYGELVAFNFPRDRQVFGPAQIEARIDNDTYISQQFTLWGQAGSTVIRGNLLTVPLDDSLLYIEPVYLQAENLNLPELKQVILATSTQVVMRPTLSEALEALLPEATSVPSREKASDTTPKEKAQDGTISTDRLKELRDQVAVLEEVFDTLVEVINKLQENNNK